MKSIVITIKKTENLNTSNRGKRDDFVCCPKKQETQCDKMNTMNE